MPVTQVRQLGDPILRERARTVSRFTFDLQRIGETMMDTVKAHAGIGLAGPQIGLPLRIVVINTEPTLFLVNPEITESKGEQEGIEGCLSIPGYVANVKRAANIKYKYRTLKGSKVKAKAEGLLARVIQHEIDHLNGVLFIDYIDAHPKEYMRDKPEKQ